MPSLTPGSVFLDYVIIRKLGSGGMGSVFLARSGAQFVALKVLLDSVKTVEEVERFQREAQTLVSVEAHPNFARVHRFGLSPLPHLVFEYVEGVDLYTWRKRFSVVDPAFVRGVFEELAQAVSFMHAQGIVHRDLKPANILLRETPAGELSPVVIDFGIVATEEVSGLTLTGAVLGTPSTMAPEQWRGDESARHQTVDIWALSVIYYFMIFGDYPYRATSAMAAVAAIEKLDVESLIAELDHVDATIIRNGLRVDQRYRAQTVDALFESTVNAEDVTITPARNWVVGIFAALLISFAWFGSTQFLNPTVNLDRERAEVRDLAQPYLERFALRGLGIKTTTPGDDAAFRDAVLKLARNPAPLNHSERQRVKALVAVFRIEEDQSKAKNDHRPFSRFVRSAFIQDSTNFTTFGRLALELKVLIAAQEYSRALSTFLKWEGNAAERFEEIGLRSEKLNIVLFDKILLPWFAASVSDLNELEQFTQTIDRAKLQSRPDYFKLFNARSGLSIAVDPRYKTDQSIVRVYTNLTAANYGIEHAWPQLPESWLLQLFSHFRNDSDDEERDLHAFFLQTVYLRDYGRLPDDAYRYNKLLKKRSIENANVNWIRARAMAWALGVGTCDPLVPLQRKVAFLIVKAHFTGITAELGFKCDEFASGYSLFKSIELERSFKFGSKVREDELAETVRRFMVDYDRLSRSGRLATRPTHFCQQRKLYWLCQLHLQNQARANDSQANNIDYYKSTLTSLHLTYDELPQLISQELAKLDSEEFFPAVNLTIIRALLLRQTAPEESIRLFKRALQEVETGKSRMRTNPVFDKSLSEFSFDAIESSIRYPLAALLALNPTAENCSEAIRQLSNHMRRRDSIDSAKLDLYFKLMTAANRESELERGYEALNLENNSIRFYKEFYKKWRVAQND